MATGWIKQKKRYREYRARVERLPARYHTAIDAVQRRGRGAVTAVRELRRRVEALELDQHGASLCTLAGDGVGVGPRSSCEQQTDEQHRDRNRPPRHAE